MTGVYSISVNLGVLDMKVCEPLVYMNTQSNVLHMGGPLNVVTLLGVLG